MVSAFHQGRNSGELAILVSRSPVQSKDNPRWSEVDDHRPETLRSRKRKQIQIGKEIVAKKCRYTQVCYNRTLGHPLDKDLMSIAVGQRYGMMRVVRMSVHILGQWKSTLGRTPALLMR